MGHGVVAGSTALPDRGAGIAAGLWPVLPGFSNSPDNSRHHSRHRAGRAVCVLEYLEDSATNSLTRHRAPPFPPSPDWREPANSSSDPGRNSDVRAVLKLLRRVAA